MTKLKLKVKFLTPCAMQDAARITNPLDPDRQRLKRFTSKRKKTESDYEEIKKASWFLALCLKDEKLVAPSRWLKKAILERAKLEKNGETFTRALVSIGDAELKVPGEKTLEQMYKDKNSLFSYERPESRSGGLVYAISPIFPDAFFETTIEFNEELMDEETLRRYILSGLRLGALPHRGYGAVDIQIVD
jgi:hypothetical protein